MNKHTPGPWTVWHASAYYNGDEPETRRLFMIDAKHGDGTTGQASADCDLIEAAPDLLDALKLAIVECRKQTRLAIQMAGEIAVNEGNAKAFAAAEAAISKAEGRG